MKLTKYVCISAPSLLMKSLKFYSFSETDIEYLLVSFFSRNVSKPRLKSYETAINLSYIFSSSNCRKIFRKKIAFNVSGGFSSSDKISVRTDQLSGPGNKLWISYLNYGTAWNFEFSIFFHPANDQVLSKPRKRF